MEYETATRSLEFVIDKAQDVFVETAIERIATLFNVKVEFKGVFAGSAQHKQWISVTGTEDEANKAKEYILALVSPAETIRMKNILGHPLFTPSKEEEIERTSGAALFKYDDDSLVIKGTEFTVMLAQSMVDDLFSKTSADVIDVDRREASESSVPDFGTNIYTKENDSASLNRNNSALTSVASQSSASTMAAAHYTDSILPSDSKSSHVITTSNLYTQFTSSGSDVFHACSSVPYKAFTENQGNWHSARDGTDVFVNANRNEKTVSEQQPATRPLFPHEYSLYASASAIYPGTVSAAPPFSSDSGCAQTKRVLHTVNHAGDGAVPKSGSCIPGNLQRAGLVAFSELPTEGYKNDNLSRMGSSVSFQARDQEAYLKNLGQSLHYSNEDIERGLADYSMDNIVKPAEFLKTLNRIKAQRHGGGHHNIGTGYRENPSVPQNSAAAHTAMQDHVSQMSVNDYIDLDASVICMGSVSDDGAVVVVSSEDEFEETNETMSNRPVAPHPPLPTYRHPAPTPSELQSTVRKEPAVRMDREATMTSDSTIMEENSAASQRPTGRRYLRYIIIDGSNVSMAHGNNRVYSVEGLRICINYFLKRGHDRITAFVPEWRRYSENQTSITGRALLEKLHNDGYVKFTPARRINGRTIASYDDRFILNLAEKEDGVVVSNDQFRDLCQERASYQNIVANRLLQFMFVGDHFMPPDDPLGRHGPHLDDFLRDPEFVQKPAFNSRKDTLQINSEESLIANIRQPIQRLPVGTNFEEQNLPERSPSVTFELYGKLAQLFPEPNQEPHIMNVLNNHKREIDLNRLTNYCMNSLFSQ